MNRAISLEPDGPAIAELERARFALAYVLAHRRGVPLG